MANRQKKQKTSRNGMFTRIRSKVRKKKDVFDGLELAGAHTTKRSKRIGLSYYDDNTRSGYRDKYIPKTSANLKMLDSMFKDKDKNGRHYIWF